MRCIFHSVNCRQLTGVTPVENNQPSSRGFLIGLIVAVAGGSFALGLLAIDSLLTLAPPAVVLAYLTLSAAAALTALLAATGIHAAARVALVMLFVGYALVVAAAWYRFATDPDMFEEQEPEPSAVLKS